MHYVFQNSQKRGLWMFPTQRTDECLRSQIYLLLWFYHHTYIPVPYICEISMCQFNKNFNEISQTKKERIGSKDGLTAWGGQGGVGGGAQPRPFLAVSPRGSSSGSLEGSRRTLEDARAGLFGFLPEKSLRPLFLASEYSPPGWKEKCQPHRIISKVTCIPNTSHGMRHTAGAWAMKGKPSLHLLLIARGFVTRKFVWKLFRLAVYVWSWFPWVINSKWKFPWWGA